jgi:hypothetical protein
VIQRAKEAYKRVLIVSAKGQTAAKLQSAKHDHVLLVPGFKKNEDVTAEEIGGLTDQMLKADAYDRETFNQISGITDSMRGNVTGDATATENAIAAGGATARMARLRSAWETGVAELGRGMAEQMFYDDEFTVEIPPEAAQQLGMKSPRLFGGREEGQKFEDLEIDIIPKSMSFPNEAQEAARAIDMLGVYERIGAGSIQFPQMNWPAIARETGHGIGNPKLADRLNDEMAEQMAGLMLGIQVQGAQPEPPDPTLASTSNKTRGGGTGGQAAPIGSGGGKSKPGTLPGVSAGQKSRRSPQGAGVS